MRNLHVQVVANCLGNVKKIWKTQILNACIFAKNFCYKKQENLGVMKFKVAISFMYILTNGNAEGNYRSDDDKWIIKVEIVGAQVSEE
jgi:hypothetical protein